MVNDPEQRKGGKDSAPLVRARGRTIGFEIQSDEQRLAGYIRQGGLNRGADKIEGQVVVPAQFKNSAPVRMLRAAAERFGRYAAADSRNSVLMRFTARAPDAIGAGSV